MQPKHRRTVFSLVLVAAVSMVTLAFVSDRPAPQVPPARFDPVTATCVGGDAASKQDCENRLEAVHSALRNASIAQEAHHSEITGYTDRVEDLEVEGFTPPEGVTLRVAEVRPDGYCLEAVDESGVMQFHLDSDNDSVLPGPCL